MFIIVMKIRRTGIYEGGWWVNQFANEGALHAVLFDMVVGLIWDIDRLKLESIWTAIRRIQTKIDMILIKNKIDLKFIDIGK